MKGALTGVTRLSSKAKCAILLLGLMVLGFIVFSMASMDQNAHSVDSNRPGGSDRSAGKTAAPAKPAFEKMFGHAQPRAPKRRPAPAKRDSGGFGNARGTERRIRFKC